MHDRNIENGMTIYSEPKLIVAHWCTRCGEPIYSGDTYYDLDEGPYCEDCAVRHIQSRKKIAEA